MKQYESINPEYKEHVQHFWHSCIQTALSLLMQQNMGSSMSEFSRTEQNIRHIPYCQEVRYPCRLYTCHALTIVCQCMSRPAWRSAGSVIAHGYFRGRILWHCGLFIRYPTESWHIARDTETRVTMIITIISQMTKALVSDMFIIFMNTRSIKIDL